MNKKFVYQVGNDKKKLYYDARPTIYQERKSVHSTSIMDSLKIVEHENFERLGPLTLKEILERDVATLFGERWK